MHNTEGVHSRVVSGEIVTKTQVALEHFQISLFCPYIAQNTVPGQFIRVCVNNSYDPLLPRPLAIYRSGEKVFDILFKVVGKGTALLAEKRVGDTINVMGPLGNGFPIGGDFKQALLVAGGIGIASLVSLAESIVDAQIIALIGASTQGGIVGADDLLDSGADVHIATDDGTAGHKGMVTELLEKVLLNEDFSAVESRIFACGPIPMLKAVAQIAAQHEITAYVSLEERMACGVGACLGCVCEVVSSERDRQYKTVCVDGPVFNAQELIWK